MSLAHDLAWCAGFFDGEGYVTVGTRSTKYKDRVYKGHYLRIGINHVSIQPLLEMQRALGGNIRKQSENTVVGKRKARHSWTLSCSQAEIALIKMMPYFKNKNNVASLGLDLQNTMSANKLALSEDIFNIREAIKQQIINLNSLD